MKSRIQNIIINKIPNKYFVDGKYLLKIILSDNKNNIINIIILTNESI